MKRFLLILALAAAPAFAQTGTVEWWPNNDPTKAVDTQAKCDAAVKAMNVSGAYPCPRMLRVTAKAIPVTWSLLGLEDDTKSLTVAAGSTVRYGKGTAWLEKVIAGTSFICWNGTFGSDPAPNVQKQCELRSGSSTTPAPVTGSAKVSWTAPTVNADGTPITDLAGFRVLYGPASGSYTLSVAASAPPVTVSNLPAGRWFFVVKAVDTASNESAASAEVSKTIQ